MKSKYLTIIYSLSILISAFLLFFIQPMYSKIILPLFGGSPQVWNTSMMFFQVVLLGGYLYAHLITKFLTIRLQLFIHITFLLGFLLLLPFKVSGFENLGSNFVLEQLIIMTVAIGGPYFIISSSAPLFQYWFSKTNAKLAYNPYFLYAASNLGSLSALLLYPFLIEPLIGLDEQKIIWKYGYILLIIFVFLCCASIWNVKKIKLDSKPKEVKDIKVNLSLKLKWILLSFSTCSLLLGITFHISTDIASSPIVWVIPLAIYLATFILAFSEKINISNENLRFSLILLLTTIFGISRSFPESSIILLVLILIAFSLLVMGCHNILASLKPKTDKLTSFYLFISFGGALGGIFNSILAPNIFNSSIEFGLSLVLVIYLFFSDMKFNLKYFQNRIYVLVGIICAILIISIYFIDHDEKIEIGVIILIGMSLLVLNNKPTLFGIVISIAFLCFFPTFLLDGLFKEKLHISRNYFGVSKVEDIAKDSIRIYAHGTTIHGAQSTKKDEKCIPLSYYHLESPTATIFKYLDDKDGKQTIANLGLGIGVLATYYKDERTFHFYEIDNAVQEIAEDQNLFTYLSDCKTDYKIILGDARLKIMDAEDEKYDLVFADAFSSDNIPVHLITREAIGLYLKKLKKDGILAFNISNRYLNLEPVLKGIADSFGIRSYVLSNVSEKESSEEAKDISIRKVPSVIFVFVLNEEQEAFFSSNGFKKATNPRKLKLWTDNYSSIFKVLGN